MNIILRYNFIPNEIKKLKEQKKRIGLISSGKRSTRIRMPIYFGHSLITKEYMCPSTIGNLLKMAAILS